jgi:AbrB family looped-hinge helix DNA binding protein
MMSGTDKHLSEGQAGSEESSVYARGQTVVPKKVREALGIEYGTRLHWEIREGAVNVIPMPQNPVQASIGLLKGKAFTLAHFLQERAAERSQERAREAAEVESWPTS